MLRVHRLLFSNMLSAGPQRMRPSLPVVARPRLYGSRPVQLKSRCIALMGNAEQQRCAMLAARNRPSMPRSVMPLIVRGALGVQTLNCCQPCYPTRQVSAPGAPVSPLGSRR